MLTHIRIAYLLLLTGLVATIVLPLSAGHPPALSRLLDEPSLLDALWRRRGVICIRLGIMYVYTFPLYLVALLLYTYAPDDQKPASPQLRTAVKGAMIAALVLPPVAVGAFLLEITTRTRPW